MSQFHRRQSKTSIIRSFQSITYHFIVVCIEYYNLKEEQERDIFNRVQMGKWLFPRVFGLFVTLDFAFRYAAIHCGKDVGYLWAKL
jgi:hypothetical protein